MRNFDCIILGAGPGGFTCSTKATQLGMNVAIVEMENLGGVCLNYGCIPTKSMLHAAEILKEIKTSSNLGINIENASIDFDRFIKRPKEVSKKLLSGIELLLKKNKVNVFMGKGSFLDKNSINIKYNNGENETIRGDNIVIATGARAKSFPFLRTLKSNRLWFYRDVLNPQFKPNKLLIIGSGAIGVEFASIYNAIGVDVEVIEYSDKILPRMDSEISDVALKYFKKLGIKFSTNSSLINVEEAGDIMLSTIKSYDGSERKIESDAVLIAAGVTPNIEELGLEKIGIDTINGYIKTNQWCETNISNVYAIGDVSCPPWLAHKAMYEGILCAQKMINQKNIYPINFENISDCIYTTPQIASVGLTETQAIEKYGDVKVGKFPFIANGKAVAIDKTDGFIKTIFNSKTGELLGAHMIGEDVTEMISSFVIAKNLETTEEDLIRTIFPHPTLSESIQESVLNTYNHED